MAKPFLRETGKEILANRSAQDSSTTQSVLSPELMTRFRDTTLAGCLYGLSSGLQGHESWL